MKKMHMTAIGALDNDRNYYIFVKEPIVEKPMNEIMEKIGYGIIYYGREEGDSPTESENRVDRIISGKYDIDIVYTQNRIILIVRAPEKEQKMFRKLMLAYSKFKE